MYGYLINCSFINNYASVSGGAVKWSEDYGNIINCSFVNNSARDDGGAVYLSSINGFLDNCILIIIIVQVV